MSSIALLKWGFIAVALTVLVAGKQHVQRYKTAKRVDIFRQRAGDIGQFRDILKSAKNHPANALPPTSRYKWKTQDSNGNYQIPYVIKGPFIRSEYRMILSAMLRIEKNTCIRFTTRKQERDHIYILNREGDGCYSYVGNHGGRGNVNLESSSSASCMYDDIVIHELLHAVGLWHEHMRHDRDKFIKVHYENIERGMAPQFAKIPPKDGVTYGVPYDYRSVMHYDKSAFAKRSGLITMETLDKSAQNAIGTAKDANAHDYGKVCAIYGCETCPGMPGYDLDELRKNSNI
uniref:Metalloendopeptidase n=1 Tax=Panagrellus redivivus TaxID=6233 RepID=A0A7E4V0W7_PANRE